MLAKQLIEQLIVKKIVGNLPENLMIKHLSQDTRDILPNTLFVCVEGTQRDGHELAKEAKEKGAVLFLASKSITHLVGDSPVIYVKNVIKSMALLANLFFDYPSQKMKMIGITGTNGKTTVSHLIDHILTYNQQKIGLIGTLYRKIGERYIETRNTTPDVITVEKSLYEMVQEHTDSCIMEVSSHALALGRVWGVDFDCVVFTNLTHEHLEFHKTMENYAAAKGLLFSQLGNGLKNDTWQKTAILNYDDAHSQQFAQQTAAEIITYGLQETADFYATEITTTKTRPQFVLHVLDVTYSVDLPMLGLFNVYNALAALAVAYVNGISLEKAIEALKHFSGVSGRMQFIETNQDFRVVIDFAHTPDGLENVLTTLNALEHRKIITVIGHSGGNRDASMRPDLGRIALEKSDYVVFTADNPRNEPLNNILNGLLTHHKSEQEYIAIDDRQLAIKHALSLATTDDIVLLAGKGAEPYQVIGDEYQPYNELEVVTKCLQELKSSCN